MRLAAAYALASHGINPGYASLINLTYHDDPTVRRKSAIYLGELGDVRALEELIRLLDDRPEVRAAAIVSLKLLAGFDAGDSDLHRRAAGIETPPAIPGTPAKTITPLQQARCWKCWYEQTRR
ncbi:MAG: HEAT repeat domain-containing protein [Pirellulales bacterium]